jgi:hypothetical protein
MEAVFNVTQILPPGYVHAHALDDAARYLVHALEACGEPARLTENHIARDARNLVLGGHLLGAQRAQLPADTILFNSEPLAEHAHWPGYAAALARFAVWDYSPRNGRGAVIPFLYCAAMARAMRPPGDALLFYGSLTPRRTAILDALRTAGVRIEVAFGTYGADRDARLARAGAVLNLHKTDDAGTFEPLRCFYPLHRGLPVISEETSDPAADDFRDCVDFVEIAGIAEAFARRDPARAARFTRTSFEARLRAALAG